MNLSIIIPVYNHFDLLNNLLSSIVWGTSHPHEIILVDDLSTDKATIDGMEWWKQNFDVRVIHNLINIGFLNSSNFGISNANGDVVCLVSTDVVIEVDLYKAIKDVINDNVLIGGIVYDGSTGWNQFGSRVFPYAEGWLLACTKDNWTKWGGFDVRYSPNDFEDVDLSTTALAHGARLVSLNNPGIRHIGAQTIGYNEQREELTKRNMKLFEEKWVKQIKGK